MHECTHEPTCDWANLASEPSERSEATKAAVEAADDSGTSRTEGEKYRAMAEVLARGGRAHAGFTFIPVPREQK